MLYSRNMLKLFELRGRSVASLSLEEGSRVGRGFADVGYEEFFVLPGSRIVSLLTGEVSSLDQIRREHLFEVLSANQLIQEIHQAGYRFSALACAAQRGWRGEVSPIDGGDLIAVESDSIEECLLRLSLAIKKIDIPSEVRCLKSVMVNE